MIRDLENRENANAEQGGLMMTMAAMLKRRAAERAAEAAAAKAARRATEDARATERAAEAELAAETARRATERAAAAAAEAAQAEQAARGKKTLAPDDRGASSSGGSDSDSMPELAAVNDSSSSDEPADRPPPRQSPQPKKPAKKKPNPKRKATKRRGGRFVHAPGARWTPGARGLYMQSCLHTCPRLPTGGDAQEPGEARFAELRKAMEASPTYVGDGSGGVSTFPCLYTSLIFQCGDGACGPMRDRPHGPEI